MKRATTLFAIILAALTLGSEVHAQKPSDSSEYLIKAGFIYNFAKFVAWPSSAFAKSDSPIVIGVLGDDSFAAVLGDVIDGKKIDGRAFVLKRLRWSKDPKDLKDCNILFIASSESVHNDEIIQLLRGTSTLSIADNTGFAKRGGIINFVLDDNNVRFEVNVDAAKQADLNISSRLLSLAKIVTGLSWR